MTQLTIKLNGVDCPLGTIVCDRIEAGTVEDPDGELEAMTTALIADLKTNPTA